MIALIALTLILSSGTTLVLLSISGVSERARGSRRFVQSSLEDGINSLH